MDVKVRFWLQLSFLIGAGLYTVFELCKKAQELWRADRREATPFLMLLTMMVIWAFYVVLYHDIILRHDTDKVLSEWLLSISLFIVSLFCIWNAEIPQRWFAMMAIFLFLTAIKDWQVIKYMGPVEAARHQESIITEVTIAGFLAIFAFNPTSRLNLLGTIGTLSYFCWSFAVHLLRR